MQSKNNIKKVLKRFVMLEVLFFKIILFSGFCGKGIVIIV